MRIKLKFFVLIICTLNIAFSTGCGKKGDAKGKDVSSNNYKIKFLLETSGSMQGYFNGNTNFKAIVTGLISKLDNIKKNNNNIKVNELSFYLIPDDYTFQLADTNPSNFIYSITNQKLTTGKSSRIDLVLNKIVNETSDNEVSIFTSDFILSYSTDEIKRNPNINLNNISALKSQITTTFNTAKQKGLAVAVYCFNSQFNGTYYDFQNKPTKYNSNAPRPFYICMVGKQSKLEKLNRFLQDEGFIGEKELYVGMYNRLPEYKILSYSDRKGNWYCTKDEKNIDNKSRLDDRTPALQFAVALNLYDYPASIINPGNLTQSIEVESADGHVSSYNIFDRKNYNSRLKSRDAKLRENFTHFVVISTDKLPKDQNRIDLELYNKDNWYKDFSTMNDSKDIYRGKTFGFDKLIDGILDSYQQSNSKYFHFYITINQ